VETEMDREKIGEFDARKVGLNFRLQATPPGFHTPGTPESVPFLYECNSYRN